MPPLTEEESVQKIVPNILSTALRFEKLAPLMETILYI